MDLITRYVANGYGIGLSINAPEVTNHANVRVLPLDDFASLEIAALWSGEPSPLVSALLEEARHYLKRQWPAWAINAQV